MIGQCSSVDNTKKRVIGQCSSDDDTKKGGNMYGMRVSSSLQETYVINYKPKQEEVSSLHFVSENASSGCYFDVTDWTGGYRPVNLLSFVTKTLHLLKDKLGCFR